MTIDGVHALRSIDPEDDEYADLAPLADALADARVVLLGEQGHSDGRTFSAKIRLIRFLHSELGFDTLAFEAGLYPCRLADEALIAGRVDPMTALGRGLHGVWLTEELRPLAAYLAAGHRRGAPLHLAGFDCQFSSLGTIAQVAGDLQRWSAEAGVGSMSDVDRAVVERLAWMSIPFAPQLVERDRQAARGVLYRLRDAFAVGHDAVVAAHGPKSAAYIDRVLFNFLANDEIYYHLNRHVDRMQRAWADEEKPGGGERFHADPVGNTFFGLRDHLQADNLLWLLAQRPGVKVIGWLANGHAIRAPWAMTTPWGEFPELTTMGELLRHRLGDRVYALSATCYRGRGSTPDGVDEIPPAPAGSLEARLHATGLDAAYVDLRSLSQDHPLREPCAGRVWGNVDGIVADWSLVTDGLLYLDEMAPSHRLPGPQFVLPE